ncbi:hypothetical protein PGQ11_010253 [Apiospora arundinis]|uniref:BZIP domain-containing protein n=1 Tax=Apiospora arundinis TaxID=335852 RepID=A0ABR2I9X3_9PEZI
MTAHIRPTRSTMNRFDKKLPPPPRPPRPDAPLDDTVCPAPPSSSSHSSRSEGATIQLLRVENRELQATATRLQNRLEEAEGRRRESEERSRLLRQQALDYRQQLEKQNKQLRLLATTVRVAFSDYLVQLDSQATTGQDGEGQSEPAADEVCIYHDACDRTSVYSQDGNFV